jgi:hypothetical protein
MSHLAGPLEAHAEPDIVEHLVPPHAGPPFYLHRERSESFYVVHGKFRFRCGANDIHLVAGQLLRMPPGLPHLYENVGEDWGRLLNVISPGGLAAFYLELEQMSRSGPFDIERVSKISAQHGIVILTAPDRESGEVCPAADDVEGQ